MIAAVRMVVYIPHSRREAFSALGWIITRMMPPHGCYSCIGEWPFDSAPVYPEAARV